jgi:predicted ATP-dependent endonuclease of OLD family
VNQWRTILGNFIEEDILNQFIVPKAKQSRHNITYEVQIAGFQDAKKQLSSGQSIILYIISEIVANIRFDSLLLYDEPETHLHPNAITQLMNTIYELVDQFQSYCIIATHSPMVIRELLSKNVFILEKNGNFASLRKIGMESFGENIATLTEEVFGNKEIPKQYKKIIEEFVSEGKTFSEVVSLLESDNVPLSLNTRLYIRALTR